MQLDLMPETARRALVVDDELLNRKLAVALLKRLGWETLEAENGQQALEILEEEVPALVLLDISMPEISGDEVCRRIRANHRLNGVRVVAYTAHAMPEDKSRIMLAGFDDLLVKPISKAALSIALEGLFGG